MDTKHGTLLSSIDEALDIARELNKDGAPTRSRQLSLAITKLEEARLWTLDAAEHLKHLEEIPF